MNSKFLAQIDWLMPPLARAEELRRQGHYAAARKEVLRVVRATLREAMPALPRLDLCDDLEAQAERLLARRLVLLNEEVRLDEPVNWSRDGDGDSQRTWHLGYQYWLNALSLRYAETKDERYARQWRTYVEEFLDGCPYAADARGYWPTQPMVANDLKTCNLGENGGPRKREAPPAQQWHWMSLSCHFRIETWLAGLARLTASPALDNAFLERVLDSLLADHAYVCVMNPRENTPNQFTAVTLSLLKLSLLLPFHRTCASYFLIAWDRLQRVYANNLYPDGSDPEQSPNYNTFLIDLGIEVLSLLDAAPPARSLPIREATRSRLRYLVAIQTPDGRQPTIAKAHDDDHTKLFRRAAHLLQDEIAEQALDEGTGPLRASLSFPYGGYHCLRHAEQYLLFKNAGPGRGHMHEDCLSFILYAHGTPVIVDPSHYTYNDNTLEEATLNAYAISSQAHNTVCIDGCGQQRQSLRGQDGTRHDERPRWTAREQKPGASRIHEDATFAFLEGVYADGYGNDAAVIAATHRRTIIAIKGVGWLLIDHVAGDLQGRAVQQHWHLGSSFRPDNMSLDARGHVLAATDDGTLLRMVRLDAAVPPDLRYGSMDPPSGWIFPAYGRKQPAIELVYTSPLPADGPLVTWIECFRGESPSPSASAEADDGAQDMRWTTRQGILLCLRETEGYHHLQAGEHTLSWRDDSAEAPISTSTAAAQSQSLAPIARGDQLSSAEASRP